MIMQRITGDSLTEIAVTHKTSNSSVLAVVGDYPKGATGEELERAMERAKTELLDALGAQVAREALWVALLQEVRQDQLAGSPGASS